MIVKLNGTYWFDTDDQITEEVAVIKRSDKLKTFAVTLWTSSGILFAQTAHAATFYENMQPLTFTFQDIALGLGVLFALTGLILLVIKKRWGVATLKLTGVVVGGMFLVPSALMLLAIIGTLLNESLTEAFQNVRNIKGMNGQ